MPKTSQAAPQAVASETIAPPANPAPVYVDRPDLAETFADKAHRMTFDGRTLRIEFCVERPDDADVKRATPVCRLVLDLDGAVDLFNKINTLQSAMESRGVIRRDAA